MKNEEERYRGEQERLDRERGEMRRKAEEKLERRKRKLEGDSDLEEVRVKRERMSLGREGCRVLDFVERSCKGRNGINARTRLLIHIRGEDPVQLSVARPSFRVSSRTDSPLYLSYPRSDKNPHNNSMIGVYLGFMCGQRRN